MSVVLPVGPGPWTVDDVPESNLPIELVDGNLVVSPFPAPRHQTVAARLVALLDRSGFAGRIHSPGEIVFDPANSREPDVLVVKEGVDLWNGPRLVPADVLLAIEVVSPNSVTTDRITKPAQYAAAGISGYWRIETEPVLRLTASVLPDDGDVYAQVGSWTEAERVVVETPIQVSFDMAELRG